jgi:hypothetical protein
MLCAALTAPALTQLLLGMPIAIDAASLVISTLQVSWLVE